jgi:hypothetical protein
MKKSLLLVLLVCTLFGYTQAQVHQDTTAVSSFRAFLPQWEKAQSRFINGDPTLWKENSSHRDDATILGGFGGYGEKGWEARLGRVMIGRRLSIKAAGPRSRSNTSTSESVETLVSPWPLSGKKGRVWAISGTRLSALCEPRKSFGKRTVLGNSCIATPIRFSKSKRHPQPRRSKRSAHFEWADKKKYETSVTD